MKCPKCDHSWSHHDTQLKGAGKMIRPEYNPDGIEDLFQCDYYTGLGNWCGCEERSRQPVVSLHEDRVRLEAAKEFVATISRQFKAEEARAAVGWIVLTTCVEGGEQMYWVNGPYDDQESALAAAQVHETDLNQGITPGEEFVCTVLPMINLETP